MGNQSTYWLNNDSTGVTLHESGCVHVQKWARPPKWVEFPTSEAAKASTRRAIRECGDCLSHQNGGGGGCFVSRYEVVEKMAARIMSEIRENPESDWQSASERIKREFACESETLYHRAQCDYPDGSDLIEEAAARKAPQIEIDAVRKMDATLVSKIKNSPRKMALWSSVKEKVLRENNLAIGALRETRPSPAPEGADLIGKALNGSGLRIVSRDDVLPGRLIEFLVKPRDDAPAPAESDFPQR